MANFKYYENDYEMAVLDLFTNNDWSYECGYDIHREKDEIILRKDFEEYLSMNYDYLSSNEIEQLITYLTGYSNQSLYRSFKETYTRLIKGYNLTKDDGSEIFIDFIKFNDTDKNLFKVVNQFEVEEYHNRRPDIVCFINGIPVSVIELKNPADITVNIHDAYEQTHIRYSRDIPSLMKFDIINVISDGANTKYGALFSDYEFYFKWNSESGKDYINESGFNSVKTLVNGLFNKNRLLHIINSYVYIPDNSNKDVVILPKYYQYFGTENMYRSILNAYKNNDSKGGTYWGATGCGKSYIMLFLSKRITTSYDLNKPTIIILTDRNDLDTQISSDFENAKNYLIDDNSISIENRKALKDKLSKVTSGGIYLMTIQKFSEDINLLSDRNNIICISDEAHRTQTNLEAKYIMSEEGTKKTYGFAKYVRDSFPNAIYVGFTGTPVDATIKVFGKVVDKYTMKQSYEDGSTVRISRLPGPREVQLDENLAKVCDEYYKLQQDSGANEYQIEESKKQMSRMEVIIGNPDRLDIVVKHFISHYKKRCEEHATVNQKAMFVCVNRKVAYEVYKRIKNARPEWFEKRKCAPEYDNTDLDRDLMEIEKVKLVCTESPNDPEEFRELIGNSKDRENYAKAFKNVKSNFKIAIVVDMWITGFDVPSLDTMYLDKPIETHNLIQTISRVNRVFKGKKEGLVVDYIGLEGAIMQAMKLYNGDLRPINGAEVALSVFKDYISRIEELLHELDYERFFNVKIEPIERTEIIQKGVEFVLSLKARKDKFMGYTKRAKKSYDVCIGHPDIDEKDVQKLHYYLCVRSVIYKMTRGDTPDATLMNKKVLELVNNAISSTYHGKQFDFESNETDDIQNLLSDEFLEKLKNIKYPNTKYQALIKLLKKAIKNFEKTNQFKAAIFSEKLKRVIEKYNSRNEVTEDENVIIEFVDSLSIEIESIYKALEKERNSFEELHITFEEKAFYDILIAIAEKYNFKEKLSEDDYINLAKKIKEEVSNKSKYTDWTNRQDVKDELYFNIAVLLKKNGYPPKPIEDAYDEIMKQVENFKTYNEVEITDDSEEDDEDLSGFDDEETYIISEEQEEYSMVAEDSEKYDPFESNKGRFKTESGRDIYYYGEEFGDSIKVINNKYDKIKTLNDLFGIIIEAWEKETAYPSAQKDPEYNKVNDPTYGQCAITATMVHDLFGGTIHKIRVNGGGTHYFNKIDGHYIDLTRDQFDLYHIPINYEPNELIDREYCNKNQDTLKRYTKLIENFERIIK